MSAELIRQAYISIQSGDRIAARTLLRRAIIKEPHNELAWYLLAQVIDKREHAIDCLKQVLLINPNHEIAARELAFLQGEEQSSVEPPPIDRSEETAPLNAPYLQSIHPSGSSEGSPGAVASSPAVVYAQPAHATHTSAYLPIERAERSRAEGQSPAKVTGLASKEEIQLSKHRRRYHVNWPLMLGTMIVILLIFIAIKGPQLATKDPLEEHVILKVGDEWLIPPFRAFSVPDFPLGSDQFGRDLLSRVLWAIQPTLTMVALVSIVRLFLGGMIGLGAGWSAGRAGRWLDTAISAALAVPVLMVALGAIAMLGAELGLVAFIIGLSINGWGETARIVREQTQIIKGQLYIEAARAMGASSLQILTRHVLRQIMSMIWMLFAFEVSHTMMVTAALGFLGYYIGGDVWIEVADFVSRRVSGTPELGQMLATSWTTLTEPWPMVLTGTVIFMIILGFNLLGEGLRLRLDPERASRNSPLARATRSASWWLEQHMIHPVGSFLRKNALPVGIVGVLLLVVSGGLYWWGTQGSDQVMQSEGMLPDAGGNLWSAERGDPFGTSYTGVKGIDDPQILWQVKSEAGFSGGPVVSAQGNLFIATRDNRLIALDSGGTRLWSAELPSTPVGSPALDGDYNIYVVDIEGGLSKLNTEGSMLWHIQMDEEGTPTHGPIAAADGRIYYLIEDHRNDVLVSASSQGEVIWAVESGTRSAGSIPRLSPEGDRIFVKNMVIAARDGRILDLESPTAQDPELSGREQYFTGADGGTYIQTGHIIMQWEESSSGLEIIQAANWNYQGAGLAQTSSYPADAGVTPGKVVWIFYSWQYGNTRVVWTDATGKLLGIAGLNLTSRSRMVAVDRRQTYYICGLYSWPGTQEGSACLAYTQGSREPLWELPLEGAAGYVTGGALVEGRLYVTTQDGILFALGEREAPVQAEVVEEETPIAMPTAVSTELPSAEVASTDVNLVDSQIDWQYQVPEPFGEEFWYNFEVTEDGWVFIHANSHTYYILDPQGELAYQFSLPSEPFQDSEGNYSIQPFILPDKSLLFISQNNIVYIITQDGSIPWEMTLDDIPQTYPSLVDGQVYLVDRAANLYVINSRGLAWRYKPQGETKGTAGAIVGPDGTVYYTALVDRKAYIYALTADGLLKWTTAVRTGFFYDDLQINGAGNLLFLKEDLYDTQTGVILDVVPPFEVDEYIMGEDGLNYLRSGNIVMQWEITSEGMQIVQTAQWNYEGLNVGGFAPRGPAFTRITPAQVIWMFYGERYIWLTLDGTVLGSPPSFGGTLTYADFLNTRLIHCNQKPGNAVFECDDNRPDSDGPNQKFGFVGLGNTRYGYLNSDGAYAVTEDNVIYKVNLTIPPP